MSELAKSHIDIIDDSSYGAGTSAIIPLIVFATEQDKVIDEDTGEIAPGTTKEVANEVIMLTSRKDVTDTYGIPQFTTVDGTVQQGDELNEVGLYGLYDALGNSSLAYAIRADIDLKQLKATAAEPTGKVENQTLWFDMTDTQYGLFRANGNARNAQAWERISTVLVPSSDSLDDENVPVSTFGNNGDIAAVCVDNELKLYENISQVWYLIGSQEWKEQFPSSATGKVGGTYEAGSSIIVNGVNVVLTGAIAATKVDDAVTAIETAAQAAGKPEIKARNENGALVIYNENTLLELSEADDMGALTSLGFDVDEETHEVNVDAVSLVFKTHSQVPSGRIAGSMWLKTTEPNYGAKYLMKKYISSSDSWESKTVPVYGSFVTAEYTYGPSLNAGSMIVKYDDDTASMKIYQYGTLGLKVTGTVANPTVTKGSSFTIKTVVEGDIKTYTITSFSTLAKDVVTAINNRKIPTLVADLDAESHLRIVSNTGNTIEFANVTGDMLAELGIAEGEASKWAEVEYIASAFEPTSDAAEGTMWFNDALNVDIMVNDGDEWKGYKNVYPCAEIFTTSEEPTEHSDGSQLQENDLWLNTASNDYPELYRYYDSSWELVDNTDQTTPLGIVFADARENAGPSYEGSTHTEFSTKAEDLLVSDYVDPNCVNPQTYAAGTLLFNTMFSTNNVKEFRDVYANAVKEIGETYQVGNSPAFITPGAAGNTKTTRWSTISGNAVDGSGLFGRKAQRAMIVKALAAAINSNEDIRSNQYDFFYISVPGYPELDDELVGLNTEKKEMFYIVSDTPARLSPRPNEITAWATNKNNAASHGEDGRIIQSAYMTRQYPSMGLTSNVDGAEIAVPTSIAKMRNLLNLPRGMFAAGTQYGQVKNLASVGYISDEEEYVPVTVREGLGEVIVANKMNPIMPQRNTGLLFWGENTENQITSSLSDEHAILTLLRMKRELDAACLPFFFRANTEALRKDFDATLRSILNDYVSREELYDYVLVTDRSVNTPERIERKELWAEIAIEIVKGVEQIYIPIRIVKTGSLSNSNI